MIRPLPGRSFTLPFTLCVLAGCGGASASSPVPPDRGAVCADVMDVRVCWDCQGGGACLVPRWTPTTSTPMGWRCAGGGAERRCVDRVLAGGPFACTKDECVQRHPRMPDDGEWECMDLGSAVMCHGGTPSAAVVEGPNDLGWSCGPRDKGPRGPEQVCVDFAPDRPRGELDGWACRFDHRHGEKRICRRDRSPVRLGGRCDAGCPEGALCVEGVCAPARPQPTCWFDTDCPEGGKCRFGTCG